MAIEPKQINVVVDLTRPGTVNTQKELRYGDKNLLTVEVTQGGSPIDLTTIGAVTTDLVVKRLGSTNKDVVGSIVDGKAQFTVDGDSLAVPGYTEAVVQFYDAAGDRISTATFSFKTLADPSLTAVGDVVEQTIIQQVLVDGPQVIADAEDKLALMDEAVTSTRVEYKGVLANDAALAALTGMQVGDWYRITSSASNGGLSRSVRYDGTTWITTDLEDPNVISTVTAQLADKADGAIYRVKSGGSGNPTSINVIGGHPSNNIANNIYAASVSGGGTVGRENVIGGTEDTVGTSTPNTSILGTNAHYSYLGGGYDNVANGLASVLIGFHNLIRSAVTHGTILGGSYHKINSGDYSTIAGGTLNQISASRATISGGDSNQIATNNGGVIAGGGFNLLNGIYAVIGGGLYNVSNGEYSTVAGGAYNQATGKHSYVGGGRNNIASAENAIVNGGQTNNATGIGALVMGGKNNNASAQNSAVLYGENNTASGINSTASGFNAKAITRGQQAFADGRFAVDGDKQYSTYILSRQTSNATAVVLGIANGNSSPAVPDKAVFLYEYKILAKSATAEGEAKAFKVSFMAEKKTGVNVAFIGSPVVEVLFSSPNTDTWTIGTGVGSASAYLLATGQVDKTINWVAKLETVEVIA